MLEKGSGREGGESAAVVANQRRPVRKSRVEQAEHQRSAKAAQEFSQRTEEPLRFVFTKRTTMCEVLLMPSLTFEFLHSIGRHQSHCDW